jgi:hypothetical protein
MLVNPGQPKNETHQHTENIKPAIHKRNRRASVAIRSLLANSRADATSVKLQDSLLERHGARPHVRQCWQGIGSLPGFTCNHRGRMWPTASSPRDGRRHAVSDSDSGARAGSRGPLHVGKASCSHGNQIMLSTARDALAGACQRWRPTKKRNTHTHTVSIKPVNSTHRPLKGEHRGRHGQWPRACQHGAQRLPDYHQDSWWP